jgi:hypothetical protein
MPPSSAFCRTQESAQIKRADLATLPNVRGLALVSAAAWARESVLAEKRERRHEAGVAREAKFKAGEAFADLDAAMSENPDRGTISISRPASAAG